MPDLNNSLTSTATPGCSGQGAATEPNNSEPTDLVGAITTTADPEPDEDDDTPACTTPRYTADTINDDQLDALYAELARNERARQAGLSVIKRQNRREAQLEAVVAEMLGTFSTVRTDGTVVGYMAERPIAPVDFERWRSAVAPAAEEQPPLNVKKIARWVPACPTGRHVVHPDYTCEDIDAQQATLDGMMQDIYREAIDRSIDGNGTGQMLGLLAATPPADTTVTRALGILGPALANEPLYIPAVAPPVEPAPAPLPEYMAVAETRSDHGLGMVWAMRCWGDGDCDGALALDLGSERYARDRAARHVAMHHPADVSSKEQP